MAPKGAARGAAAAQALVDSAARQVADQLKAELASGAKPEQTSSTAGALLLDLGELVPAKLIKRPSATIKTPYVGRFPLTVGEASAAAVTRISLPAHPCARSALVGC